MTTLIYKYRIYCNTDNKWVYTWATTPPIECPDDSGHSFNSSSVSIIQVARRKVITSTDSPYYTGLDFLSCDTTSGNIELRLKEASSCSGGVVRIVMESGGNNVNIYNGNDVSTIFVINSNALFLYKSNGTIWEQISIDAEDDLVNNLEELSSGIINTQLLGFTHSKGDIITADDRSNRILPVGNDDYILIADSNTSTGLKWGQFTPSIDYTLVTSTTIWSTTSSSFITINGMTTTPSAGTYYISFSSTIATSKSSTKAIFSVFNNNIETVHSRRMFSDGRSNNGSDSEDQDNDLYEDVVGTQSIETVNGSQLIEIRVRKENSGSIKYKHRNLVLIKLS